jgi:hypothetical protein
MGVNFILTCLAAFDAEMNLPIWILKRASIKYRNCLPDLAFWLLYPNFAAQAIDDQWFAPQVEF